MKRDVDLIRNMLLLIESCPDVPPRTLRLESFLDISRDIQIISLHLELLIEAGFIEAEVRSVQDDVKDYDIFRITYAGYEYLDSVRDAKIWRDVKQKISAIGGATFEIIKMVAEAEITKALQV